MSKIISLCSCLFLSFVAVTANGAVIYWDPNGTTSIGGNGTWDTTTAEWSPVQLQTNTSGLIPWVSGDAACFSAGPNGSTSQGTFTIANNTVNLSIGGIYNGSLNPGSDNLTIGGTGSFSIVAGIDTFSTGGTVSGTTTINIPINGPGLLQNQSSGTLVLNGIDTYTGGTYIDGSGALTYGNNNSFGTGPISWLVAGYLQPAQTTAYTITNTVTNGAVVETFAGNSSGVTFTGPWYLPTNGASITTLENISGTINVAGPIAGSAAILLTNRSGSVWIFSGTNTYTNTTLITNQSILVISNAGNLGSGNYAGRITNNGTFFYDSSYAQTLSGIISGNGLLVQNGSGPLTLSGVDTFTNSISNGTSLIIGGSGGLAGTFPGKITNNGTFLWTSSAGSTLSGVISGTGSITQGGTGSISLTGVNTYTGLVAVTNGQLAFNSDSSFGAVPTSFVPNAITLNGGSNVSLRANATFSLSANRGISLGSLGGQIQIASGFTLTYPGVISGPGSFQDGASISTGAGTLIFSGANTYTGSTLVGCGILRLGASGALPFGTPLTVAIANAGSTFDLNGFSQTTGPLASGLGIGGTGIGTPTILLTGALTVLETNVNTTFTGNISGANGSLTLSVPSGGTGSVLTLIGTNTYSGATALTAGSTLALDSSSSISNTSSLTIVAGATFNVSAIPAYNLSTTLSASGTTTPATIVGGTTVSLGSEPIVLTYDGSDPALVVSQGTLVLHGNAFTVNGAALPVGSYPLITQSTGAISSSGSFTVTGSAIGSGLTASISVSGGTVYLVLQGSSSFTSVTSSQSISYGTGPIVLSGMISGTAGYAPSNGEPVMVTIDGMSQSTAVSGTNGNFSVSFNSSTIPVSASPYAIIYSYGGDSNLISSVNSNTSLTVTPAAVTVTALPQSKTYGQTLTFGSGSTQFTNTALQDGQTIGSVTLTSSGGASNSPVSGSPYTITPSAATGGTFSPSNYSITYITNSLTVNPLAVVLNGTEVYNGTTNVPSSSLSISNAIGGDDVSLASGSATVASPNIGVEPITSAGTLVLGGTTASNYTLVGVSGTVTVTPLPVDLTGTRPYDGSNDASASILSFATNYDTTNLTLSGSALLAGSGVGVQSITDFSGLTLGGSASTNYTLTNAIGSVTITSVATSFTNLTPSQAVTYGTSNVTLSGTVITTNGVYPTAGETISVTIDGLTQTTATSDASGDFSLLFNASTIPVSGSPYTITYSYGGDSNVTSSTDSSTSLTVTPASVTVTALPESKTYGQTLTFASGSTQFTSTPLQNGDTITSVTLASAGGASNAPVSGSPYTITPSAATGTFSPSNYLITYVPGSLTINPLAVVLNGSEVYNGTTNVPSSSLSISNAVSGDDVSLASGSATIASPNIGVEPITSAGTLVLGGTTASNYTLVGVSGAVTVTPLAVDLTGSRLYDGSNDASASILSFATNYDSTNLTLSGTALLAGSSVGVQSITNFSGLTLGGSAATNYTLTNAIGSVTITSVATAFTNLTPSQVVTYGASNVTLSGTVTTTNGIYPAAGETVTATIDGITQSNVITDLTGDFTLIYSLAGIPASATPYTITYAYAGDGSFNAASDSSTALTVNPLSVILAGSRGYDGTAIAAAGILSVVDAINGDNVTVASGTATLSSASVGTNAIINFTNLTLGGLNASNYTLVGASGSVVITNSFSPFSITSASLDATGTNFMVCFQSTPGASYDVLTNYDLTKKTWGLAAGPITATNTTTCYTFPGGVTGTSNVFVEIKQQ